MAAFAKRESKSGLIMIDFSLIIQIDQTPGDHE
jgi:hypothetical protein